MNRILYKQKVIAYAVASLLVPCFSFAYTSQGYPENFLEFVNNFMKAINIVLPFVMGFGFFGIFTGLLKYVSAGGDEERLGKAKQLIVYGLIGIVILFTFWGLAKLLAKTYLGV